MLFCQHSEKAARVRPLAVLGVFVSTFFAPPVGFAPSRGMRDRCSTRPASVEITISRLPFRRTSFLRWSSAAPAVSLRGALRYLSVPGFGRPEAENGDT